MQISIGMGQAIRTAVPSFFSVHLAAKMVYMILDFVLLFSAALAVFADSNR